MGFLKKLSVKNLARVAAAGVTGGASELAHAAAKRKKVLKSLAAGAAGVTAATAVHRRAQAPRNAGPAPLNPPARNLASLNPVSRPAAAQFIPTSKLPAAGLASQSKTSPTVRNAAVAAQPRSASSLVAVKAGGSVPPAQVVVATQVVRAVGQDALKHGVPVPGRIRFLTPTGLHLVPFKWISVGIHKVAVPECLIPELSSISISLDSLLPIFNEFPRIRWMVSSIRKDFMGRDRGTATSHYLGKSIDLAGFSDTSNDNSPILYSPRVKSPRFADRRMFLRHLALATEKAGPTSVWGVAAEGDHLHVTTDLKGAWAYSTYRSEYEGDTTAHSADLLSKKLYRVTSDGTISPLPRG